MASLYRSVRPLLAAAKSANNVRKASTQLKRSRSFKEQAKSGYDLYKGLDALGGAVVDLREASHRPRTGRQPEHHNHRREYGTHRHRDYHDRGSDRRYDSREPRRFESRWELRPSLPARPSFYRPAPRARTVYVDAPRRQYYDDDYYAPRSATWTQSTYRAW